MGWCGGVFKWLDMLIVLLWKEMMIRLRSPIHTFFEISLIVLTFLLVYYAQGQSYINSKKNKTVKASIDEAPSARIAERISIDDMMRMSDVRIIYYTPPDMKPLMELVAKKLGVAGPNLISHHNEVEMMSTRFVEMQSDQSMFAVIFDTQNKTNPLQEMPQLIYTIRNSKKYKVNQISSPFRDSEPHEQYGLIYEAFVALQMAIDQTYIEMRTGNTIKKSMSLQMYPYQKEKPLPSSIEHTYREVYPSTTINSFAVNAIMLTLRLSQDKTNGIKALLKTAGCTSVMLYTGSILSTMLVAVPGMIAASYLMSITAERSPIPWPSMSMSVLFVFFMIYLLQLSALCSLITAIMPSHNVAVIATLLLILVFYQIFAQMSANSVRGFFVLLPDGCVIWFFEVVGQVHMRGEDFNWGHFSKTVPGEFGLGMILLITLATCIPYFFFTWYFDCVTPGQYGVPERWNFLFTKRYWLSYEEDTSSITVEHHGAAEHYEPPIATTVGIRISNLWKIFKAPHGQKHAAVAGVSMDMYDKEITVLLGQNGAGKTTLMSIITGMIAQSSGSVDILEGDNAQQPAIDRQRKKKKHKIGYCPQFNALIMNLTCDDHLYFFAKLHNGIRHSVKDIVDRSSRSINLTGAKAHNRAGVLSGGEQRRLQLGCAIASGARTLVLDEPTSGLDPRARRSLWDILLKLRGSHTVLVSTHYMDEADALADRIAVMRMGQLVCFGTPMFLKRAFGTGYRLSILKTPECDPIALEEEIFSYVQGAEVVSSTNEQVIFKLPSDSSSAFPGLFNRLEKDKDLFGITTIGVGITTLEEIFLMLANVDAEESTKKEPETSGTESQTSVTRARSDLLLGFNLHWHRYKALAFKQIKYERNSLPIFIIVRILLPLIMTFGATSTMKHPHEPYGKSNKINVSMYPYMSTVYYADSSNRSQMIKDILNDKSIIKNTHTPIDAVKTNNVTEAILRMAKNDKNLFLDGSLIAAEFEEDRYNGLFSTSVYHAMPIVANFIDNVLAYEMFSDAKTFGESEISLPLINVVNEPILRNNEFENQNQKDKIKRMTASDIIMWASLACLGVFIQLFLAGSLPVQERGGVRRQIRMCGVPVYMFWLFSLLWEYVGYLIVCGFIILITYFIETFSEPSFLFSMFTLLAAFGLAGLAFIFLLGFLSHSTAYSSLMYVGASMMFGNVMPVILFGLYEMDKESSTVGQIFFAVSCLVPHYSLTRGLINIGYISLKNKWCVRIYDEMKPLCDKGFVSPPGDFQNGYCCNTKILSNGEKKGPFGYMSSEGHRIGVQNLCGILLAQAIVFMSLVLLLDSLPQGSLWAWIVKLQGKQTEVTSNDESVEEENKYVHRKVENLEKNKHWDDHEDALICKDIHKSYFMCTKKPLQAVRGVNLATKHGKCFGLLGENGAGKSSLITILVGSSAPTLGTAYVNSTNLKSETRKYLSQIGYCPQFDAVSPYLTARQQLEFLLKMQGAKTEDIKPQVDKWIAIVGLEFVMNKISGKYSGGQRRRLSAACALLLAARGALNGDVKGITLMDEPTAGVDPAAARQLWTALKKEQEKGASILLSTHSMHETEMLCDRLGIISKGKFVALGSSAALRAKYSWGYTATLKLVGLRVQDLESGITEEQMLELNEEHSRDLKEAFKRSFPTAELKDDRQTMIQYRIFTKSLTYGDLFSQMEHLKAEFPNVMEDYSVSETSLEEVFLTLSGSEV